MISVPYAFRASHDGALRFSMIYAARRHWKLFGVSVPFALECEIHHRSESYTVFKALRLVSESLAVAEAVQPSTLASEFYSTSFGPENQMLLF